MLSEPHQISNLILQKKKSCVKSWKYWFFCGIFPFYKNKLVAVTYRLDGNFIMNLNFTAYASW